ncbi:MAG: ABC transporter permease [Armatimonadota bacterium]
MASQWKPAVLLVGILLAWEVFVRTSGVPNFVLPPPSRILAFLAAHWQAVLYHALVTIRQALSGFLLSVTIGIFLGIVIVQFKFLEEAFLPLLVTTQVIPTIAIAPLLVIWLGFGSAPKIAVAFLVSFFPIVINTVAGLRAVEEDLLYLIRGLSATRWQELFKIRFPHALPYLFAAFRVSITLSLIGGVVGEFVSADQGLGFLILVGSGRLQTEQIFASILVLGIAGIGLFNLILALERLLLPWTPSESAS